jgi:hypothetical protein
MTGIDNEADVQVCCAVAELLNTHADDVMLGSVVGETGKMRLAHGALVTAELHVFVHFVCGVFSRRSSERGTAAEKQACGGSR